MPASAVDCIQPALHHTRSQLFTHFRWGQWARLALVGILAAELHVGGCGFSNLGRGWPHAPHKTQNPFLQSRLPQGFPPLNPAHLSEHIGQFIGLILLGMLAVFVLGFIFLYISSVFRFILFDSVVRRECSISAGWTRYRRAGGRYFLWQIVYTISVWVLMFLLLGVPLSIAFAAGWMKNLGQHVPRLIVGVLFLGGVFLFATLAVVVVQILAKDFLVPLMALEGLDFADGWHHLLAIIRPQKGSFALYLLMKLVLAIAAGILFTILAVLPILLVTIPTVVAVLAGRAAGMGWNVTTISLVIIIGSVLLLLLIYLIALVSVPATVFFPAYALYFLAPRYPILEIALNPPPVPAAPEISAIPESSPPFDASPLPPSAEPIG